MIMNSGTADEAKVMTEFFETFTSPEEALANWEETQFNSPYLTEQKGLAGRYKTSMNNTYWNELLILAARE